MHRPLHNNPFNSPLETGMRSLIMLKTAFPARYDLQRLTVLDYLIVHSADIEGPESLHAPLPFRSGELLVRRGLIERGLFMMIRKGLIERCAGDRGFEYTATETAAPFIANLSSPYTRKLCERAQWLLQRADSDSEDHIFGLIRHVWKLRESEFAADKGRR